MDDSISVVEASNVDDELIAALGSLVRQLSTSASFAEPAECRYCDAPAPFTPLSTYDQPVQVRAL